MLKNVIFSSMWLLSMNCERMVTIEKLTWTEELSGDTSPNQRTMGNKGMLRPGVVVFVRKITQIGYFTPNSHL